MKIIKIAIYCIALMTMFGACKDAATEITEVHYPRAFSPINLTVQPTTFDKATVTWKPIDGAISYVVELSQGDSLLFDNIIDVWDISETTTLSLTELWGETKYSIRVRSKAFDTDQNDSKWTSLAFKTSAEQIFNVIRDVEVKGVSATVRWVMPEGTTATKLNVSGSIGDIALDAADLAAGYKVVTGLTPDTEYTIGIYNGDQRRGQRTIVTQWKPTGSESNVVMVSNGQDLSTICADAGNIGKIVYLPDGYTFETSSSDGILIVGNMSIYGDPDAVVKPLITTTSTGGGAKLFRWPGACNIDELKFVNLSLGATGGTGNQASVLHPGTAAGTDNIVKLTAIRFEYCDIQNFGRCFLRIQNIADSKAIGTVSLNNCYAYNCCTYNNNDNGVYAFFTLNVANGGVDNIVVKNSTIQHQYHSFVNAPFTSPNNPCKSVNIENCTFNDFITGPTATTDRYFLDANNNTAISMTIKNTIFGQSGPTSLGYRYSTATSNNTSSITVTGSYKTSDFFIKETTPSTNLPNLIAYSGPSTALWTSPATGSFYFLDANFVGRAFAGDPRWR